NRLLRVRRRPARVARAGTGPAERKRTRSGELLRNARAPFARSRRSGRPRVDAPATPVAAYRAETRGRDGPCCRLIETGTSHSRIAHDSRKAPALFRHRRPAAAQAPRGGTRHRVAGRERRGLGYRPPDAAPGAAAADRRHAIAGRAALGL